MSKKESCLWHGLETTTKVLKSLNEQDANSNEELQTPNGEMSGSKLVSICFINVYLPPNI